MKIEIEQWLMQNSPILGNILLSGLGLAFAFGAPAKRDFKTPKKCWMIFWSSLLGVYFFSVFDSILFIILGLILNGISTAAIAMLYLYPSYENRFKKFSSKRTPKIEKSIIIFILVFSVTISSTASSVFLAAPINYFAFFISQSLSWLFFVLLAWKYRKQHIPTMLLLLAYANLQLPAALIGKGGFNSDLVLLLLAKLSLIGAMYHTLGVRNAK